MKKLLLFLCIAFSFFLLPGASVWEGTAAMDEEGFQETGRFVATNSFPVNTIVDVTNLETGKQERFIVSSSLEIPGLLAVFSKDAALAIDLPARTLVRISMTESADQTIPAEMEIAYSNNPPYEFPGAFDEPDMRESYNDADIFTMDPMSPFTDRIDGGELIVDLPQKSAITQTPQPVIPQPVLPQTVVPEPVASQSVEPSIPDYDELTLLAAEERPPESEAEDEPEYFLSAMIPTFENSQQAAKEQTPDAISIPMIQSFEKGKYYLQIGAFRNMEAVETVILQLERQLPKAIMNIGTEREPTYRVLIGPLNLGESNALLQRLSPTYKDAFVWLGR